MKNESECLEPMNASILIVDDEPLILSLLRDTMATTSHTCYFAEDGQKALDILKQHHCDVVLTDIDMPHMDGIELARIIVGEYSCDVIVMTGQIQNYQYDEIVSLGASDFVEKPFSPKEMILRITRVLRERCLRQEASNAHNALKESYIDSIHRLVMAAEYKDEDTGDHIVRIGSYCALIAEKLGASDEFIDNIYYASPMHDIGKIGIPDKILLKPGKLNHVEFETIKTHTLIGARLLSQSKSKILEMARQIALNHHEKYDGTGYPNGLQGESIPLEGRICAIADTFDALTSKRPYKNPYPFDVTYDILKKERGRQFDPRILDMFIENYDDFVDIRKKTGPMDEYTLSRFSLSERDEAQNQSQSNMTQKSNK
ncbi:MAG: response regulator [Desulfobacteraceae bacterium]|nr:MAG: response regulator [Desulfobacteraceae bacterium]